MFGVEYTDLDTKAVLDALKYFNLNFEIDKSNLNDNMKEIKSELPFFYDLMINDFTNLNLDIFLSSNQFISKIFAELSLPISLNGRRICLLYLYTIMY